MIDLEVAKTLQRELADQLILSDCAPKKIHFIAGMDVSSNRFDPNQMVYASVVILKYPDLNVIETHSIFQKETFPYIPGFLSFREAPALLKAFEKCKTKPDVLFVDGQGIAHPRRLGIASHIGILLDLPSIGVAKSILVGKTQKVLGASFGSTSSLVYQQKQVGFLLCSKPKCLPLVVSPGHKISFERSIELVLSTLRRYRLPEPTRQAHLASNAFRKSVQSFCA